MNEVAVPEPPNALDLSPLAIWADSARRAASVAVSLAKTPFVPQSLRENPKGSSDEANALALSITAANITAAILTGQEVGLEPMASLRSIDVIQGTPAMRAITLRALVQSKGHEVWVVETNSTRAIVAGRRHGSEKEQRSTWTMDRARALGLVSKDNWRKQPEAMLVARATSELCRLIAADVILGIPYSVEELEDGPATSSEPSTFAPPARTARRKTAPEPIVTAEPEVPALDADAAEIMAELAAETDEPSLLELPTGGEQ